MEIPLESEAVPGPPVFELIGDYPPEGTQFCACCCMLYLGAVSADKTVQENARAKAEAAIARGDRIIRFHMPTREDKLLRVAVTTAPSVYFQIPMPVCWIHMQGYNPQSQTVNAESGASPLIPGKAHQWKGNPQ